MYDIITVGSATMDCFVDTGAKLFHTIHKDYGDLVSVPFGSKITVDTMRFFTGGGGTNSAVAIARLGLKVAYIGKLGGEQSHIILDELKREEVDTSFIVKSDDTGFSVVLDARGKDRTVLAFKGSNNKLSFNEIKLSKVKAKWFYMASMMGKSYETLIKLAKYAKKNKIKVAFNPSSYIARQGTTALKGMLDCTDVLIVNKEEAIELLGRNVDIETALKALRKFVKDIILITDGKNGCYCYTDRYYFIRSKGNHPVETTGAGDSFGSTFVSGLCMGKDVVTCLRMAQSNAESVIMYYGAKNILLTRHQLEENLKRENWHIDIKDI